MAAETGSQWRRSPGRGQRDLWVAWSSRARTDGRTSYQQQQEHLGTKEIAAKIMPTNKCNPLHLLEPYKLDSCLTDFIEHRVGGDVLPNDTGWISSQVDQKGLKQNSISFPEFLKYCDIGLSYCALEIILLTVTNFLLWPYRGERQSFWQHAQSSF
jgi:hypothetical protein